jgi:hypothetical protein
MRMLDVRDFSYPANNMLCGEDRCIPAGHPAEKLIGCLIMDQRAA